MDFRSPCLPAAEYMLQEQEAYAVEIEHTFIAIKPDRVQRELISEIVGFKLVAIKLVVPSKDFAQKHYHDLKERPFFNGLCDFLSGPVLAMVKDKEVPSLYKLYTKCETKTLCLFRSGWLGRLHP
ncbi:hypothetical protein MKW98_011792 [Papaver atlanticum]|uniref:nucleoside-diphosphate kinase n=1 Tax=Papaver atlanticum TaxID=357466 RepID=A0AAD4SN53_9MAGN|nr:hypothetical protein MKW98_011792 [Papaver atlanticum]